MASIELKNINKRFGEQCVLNDVSLSFQPGKIYGIIGRNGSGKSVLFKCICGFVYPDSGEIRVNGEIISKGNAIPKDMGIIIESPGFLPNYSGFYNLYLLSKLLRKINKEQIKEVLTKVGLNAGSKKPVAQYSLGMKQRLGLAQAIMENPSILILDEPMNGLDNVGVKDIRKILLELKEQGKTIIISSHNKEDIAVLCDIVYEMDRGCIQKLEK